ncbi:hypothetical protein Brsp04_04333 [Brucella sp. NBRC 12952]
MCHSFRYLMTVHWIHTDQGLMEQRDIHHQMNASQPKTSPNWPQRLILAAITLPIDEALEGQAAVARRILRHC